MEGNSCDIAILLYGNSLEIDEASKLLSLTPTQTRVRGDVRTTASGSQVHQKIGFWEYRLCVGADHASQTILEMVGAIRCGNLRGSAGIERAELDIFVPLNPELDENSFSLNLSCELMLKLANLGMDLTLTSY